tara:strand:- start:11424 stop:12212 length:789 start_codon:yes stop_codon:yes gene_type:complete
MNAPARWILNAKVAPSVFRRNIEHNMGRGLEQCEIKGARNGSLYIVCSGPSLREMWPELLDADGKRKGEIWALNSAFDYLCDKGIRPDYGVCLAPEKEILRYFQKMQAGDKFMFAATTHIDLVDRALDCGATVVLWHSAQPEEWDLPVYAGPLVFGGGTVGTRAIDLAWLIGWRDVHVLGMDASLSTDDRIGVETPMYDDRRDSLEVFLCNGRAFVAMPSHARQVEDFASVIRPLHGLDVTLYGDGLLQWSQCSTEQHAQAA